MQVSRRGEEGEEGKKAEKERERGERERRMGGTCYSVGFGGNTRRLFPREVWANELGDAPTGIVTLSTM